MVDIHCHILPKIDDGAKDINIAIQMARLAEMQEVNTIIATPHFWYGHYENSFEEAKKKADEMNSVLVSNNIKINILPGQEIFLDDHTLEFYKSGIVRGINDLRYLLIELPMDKLEHSTFETIYELRLMGAEVIIAHPERYMYVIDRPSSINEFIEEGCFFQINAGSIMGIMGNAIKKTSEILIKHNICDFIATDAHGIGRRRPGLKEVYKHINKDIKRVVMENSQNLIENNKIQSFSEKVQEKSFFSFFKKTNTKWSD